MNVHQLTAGQLRALANGTAGTADLEILARGQRSKVLAMLALLPRQAAEAGHPEAAAAQAGWDLLADVQRLAPVPVAELLGYPPVGSWAAETLLALESPARTAARPGRLALIAAAAAIRGNVRCTVEVPAAECSGPVLHLPSLGSATLPDGVRGHAAVLVRHGGTTELHGQHASMVLPGRLSRAAGRWRPLSQVTAGAGRLRLRLVIDDADPYRLPGYDGSLELLTGRQAARWRRRVGGGWRLLARDHRRTAADVLAMISALTPLGGTATLSRSITARRAIGTVGLSLPEDDVAMAATLAHEVQHAKLGALMDLLPLVAGSGTELYYAPWRPDPRPLASMLHGMYAHLGMARFWRRHRYAAGEPARVHRADVEFARLRSACWQVGKVVGARPELTRSGAIFVAGMIHEAGILQRERVPRAAQAEAERAAEEHRRSWDIRHGGGAKYARTQ